jgi:6-phosphogluconate dehydrogenase
MENTLYDFGMVGLGVMGSNLLLNIADNGFKVVGYDTNPVKTAALESSATKGTMVKGVNTLHEMLALLQKPRKIMMLVPAGNPVDSVIADLAPLIEPGDLIIDGGNSHYTDTIKRISTLKDKNINFMGIGISGGEQGARLGPSIMPGGDQEAYKHLEPILQAIAAKVNNRPCVGYLGKSAAGHYVKMVHNGIEYAIMQLISECYDLLHNGLGLNNDELHEVFGQWNNGEMKSFLLEITSDVFLQKDEKSDARLIDMILDKAGAKGTGKWTSQEGLDLSMPIPSIDMAVMMRNLSSLKEERVKASALYNSSLQHLDISKDEFIMQLHDALYFATIISYTQGLAILHTASINLKMEIPLPEVVRVWAGGCIIRSALLNVFSKAFEKDKNLPNLLLDSEVVQLMQGKEQAIKNVLVKAIQFGYPSAGLTASLHYFEGYKRNNLPTNLIQAQRDYFGSHTYERIDGPGIFHTGWQHAEQVVDHSSGH